MRSAAFVITALLSACSFCPSCQKPGFGLSFWRHLYAADIYGNGADVAGKDAVIFLHGYYGSALREKGGGPRRFIRIPTILAGSFAIALDSEALGHRPSPELEVEGLLARVSVLPFFYSNDVYGDFLAGLGGHRPVVALAYDWRKDLFEAVRELDALVKNLQSRGAKSVSIFAHSMGGLVAAYYLAYGAQDPATAKLSWAGAQSIAKVAFLGVPFGGAVAIFRNMQLGTGYPWNEDLLEAGTVSSWPASYYLIPLESARMLDPSGKEITVPIEDPAFWQQHRLGLLREEASGQLAAIRLAYTGTQLRQAKKFKGLLQVTAPPPAHLRVLNIRGKGRPTLAKGYFDGEDFAFLPRQTKKRGWPFAALEEDGDGSVPLASTALPTALAAVSREIFTDFAHDRLFADPAVEKECLDFLAREN